RRAVCALRPDDPTALTGLGHALTASGQHQQAIEEHRRASCLQPGPQPCVGLVAACVADPTSSRATVADELAELAARLPARASDGPLGGPIEGRPLGVGFLSSRFAEGGGLALVLPLVERRERGDWHALLYSGGPANDSLGRRLRHAASAFTDISELDDE